MHRPEANRQSSDQRIRSDRNGTTTNRNERNTANRFDSFRHITGTSTRDTGDSSQQRRAMDRTNPSDKRTPKGTSDDQWQKLDSIKGNMDDTTQKKITEWLNHGWRDLCSIEDYKNIPEIKEASKLTEELFISYTIYANDAKSRNNTEIHMQAFKDDFKCNTIKDLLTNIKDFRNMRKESGEDPENKHEQQNLHATMSSSNAHYDNPYNAIGDRNQISENPDEQQITSTIYKNLEHNALYLGSNDFINDLDKIREKSDQRFYEQMQSIINEKLAISYSTFQEKINIYVEKCAKNVVSQNPSLAGTLDHRFKKISRYYRHKIDFADMSERQKDIIERTFEISKMRNTVEDLNNHKKRLKFEIGQIKNNIYWRNNLTEDANVIMQKSNEITNTNEQIRNTRNLINEQEGIQAENLAKFNLKLKIAVEQNISRIITIDKIERAVKNAEAAEILKRKTKYETSPKYIQNGKEGIESDLNEKTPYTFDDDRSFRRAYIYAQQINAGLI